MFMKYGLQWFLTGTLSDSKNFTAPTITNTVFNNGCIYNSSDNATSASYDGTYIGAGPIQWFFD